MSNWYALYVKSRHEFVTQSDLTGKGICCFLPTVKKMSQWKDRRKLIETPLFPGYIFARVQAVTDGFLSLRRARGAVDLVALEPGVPAAVPDEEMDSLMLLMESGQHLDVYPELKQGMRVRVRRGPLQGAVGTLEKRDEQYKLLVNVDILGRSVGVHVYVDDVEAD